MYEVNKEKEYAPAADDEEFLPSFHQYVHVVLDAETDRARGNLDQHLDEVRAWIVAGSQIQQLEVLQLDQSRPVEEQVEVPQCDTQAYLQEEESLAQLVAAEQNVSAKK